MDAANQDPRDEGNDLEASPRLVAALKKLQPTPFVPPTVDEAILRAAQKRFAKQPSALQRRQLWWGIPATACVVLIVIAIQLSTSRKSVMTREDLNHDGRVDILDAFQLARELESGTKPAAGDVNGDGAVDLRDTEIIAARAVKLEKGGPS